LQGSDFRLIGSRKHLGAGAALTSRLQSFGERSADARREPCRAGRAQTGVARQGGRHHFTARVCWTWTAPKSGSMAGGAECLQRSHSSYPLIIRCCVQPGGDCLAAKLRPGNVHSADGWRNSCCLRFDGRRRAKEVAFRGDAAFAKAGALRGAGSAGSEGNGGPPSRQRTI